MNNAQQTILFLLVTATLIPLASSIVLLFIGQRLLGKVSGFTATGLMGLSFACSVYALVLWLSQSVSTIVWKVPWIPLPGLEAQWLYLGALVDPLTVAMMTMVTGISLLVHLYSTGYMADDPRYPRFFAYLSLFTFSMLGIVMSHSLVMIFIFWELVGLTSYLLIGFWFEKKGPQLACRKAFVMNRVGDMGFLIGFGIMFYQLGGKVFLPACEGIIASDGSKVLSMLGGLLNETQAGGLGLSIVDPPMWLTIAGIGLFFGAIGKSAQFPLHTWLPDAMEGPTPVSSIVHSATMVAAGVYLTGRLYPILTPSAHLFIAIIGLITLIIAALMALVMTDIKRVLAYSTLSQLGYMTLGLGAGAYAYALYHLITHAFFKCCLFQCAGSVIHGAHHQQDMRYYGGLWRKMPVTAVCFAVCVLAIAGASAPFTNLGVSGFYSKDGILAGTYNFGTALAEQGWWAGPMFYWGPTLVAYLTVFYMGRSFALTFLGTPRDAHLYEHAHEAPWQMLVPQVVLAVMAVVSVPGILPLWLDMSADSLPATMITWVQPSGEENMAHAFHWVHASLLHGFGWIISLSIAVALFGHHMGRNIVAQVVAFPLIKPVHTWIGNKFYFDELYDQFVVGLGKFIALVLGAIDRYLVDGVVNLVGHTGRLGAWVIGRFDDKVIDGTVSSAADMAWTGGQLLRTTQMGRVRVYVLLSMVSLTVVALFVVVTLMVKG